ncbi:NB-ARC domain-containing protein [Sciscionella marina]|uniref:NB-ARC domain-containing protein n=1 Tax=Sciscionella marina TaxID=508770 RepID=UPI00036D2F51|nr:NB-ARC domain-containing protein [Sciscionella marina]
MDGGANQFEGRVGKLVQAGQVYGDINLNYGPPERTVVPYHLGRRVSPYANNTAQLRQLTELLTPAEQEGPARLALVCGGPGSGRSALVTHVANDLRDCFPGGIVAVSLGAKDDELVRVKLAELLSAVGYDLDRIPASLEGRAGVWRSWSKGKRLLLIIDDALTRAQVEALLPGPGRSSVAVVRSGAVTGLVGRDRQVHMEPLSDESARALLGELTPGLDLDAEPDALGRLLDRCAGSVLALRAVGALLEEMSPVRLAGKLAEAETALRALSRLDDVAVRAVFDTAYHRLDDDPLAQECYRFLGVHPPDAGVTLEAAAAILDQDAEDVEFALTELVRRGLAVEVVEQRYQIATPQLVRPHAAVLLREADEDERVRRRIVAYYLHRALACSRAWMPERIWLAEIWAEALPAPEPDSAVAQDWLRAERTNLRAVVDLAYGLGELDQTCRFAVALWPLHDQDKHTLDMIAVCEGAARAADELSAPLAASVVRQQLAFGYRELRDLDKAAETLMTALRDAGKAGSLLAEYSAKEALGLVCRDQGALERAELLLKENHEFARRSGDPRRDALASFHYGSVARDPREAGSLFDLAAERLRAEPYNLAKIAYWRGRRLVEFGRHDEAVLVLADAAEQAKAGGWHTVRVQACQALADLAHARGEVEAERLHLTTALEIVQVRGFSPYLADVILDRLEQLPPLPR